MSVYFYSSLLWNIRRQILVAQVELFFDFVELVWRFLKMFSAIGALECQQSSLTPGGFCMFSTRKHEVVVSVPLVIFYRRTFVFSQGQEAV